MFREYLPVLAEKIVWAVVWQMAV